MDEDIRELISLLTTQVGTIMEDSSADALTCGRKPPEDMKIILDGLEVNIARMSALIGAAKALVDQSAD